jgi:hypothetical protein
VTHPRTIGRVNERLTLLFLQEIQTQCEIVELAAVFLEHAIEHGPSPDGDPAIVLWMPLQTILGAATNISRLCWGSGRKKERAARSEELEELRDTLGLDDSSPLAPGHVGNAFDRLDRRLEAYAADSEADPDGWEPRRFDEVSWDAQLFGDDIAIRDLGVETSRVLTRIRTLLARGEGTEAA